MQYIQLQGQVAATLDTPLDGGFNLFIDTADGTIKAKDSEGNISSTGGGGIVDTTYSELYGLWDDIALIAGTYYKITDFKTCYDQPDYNVFGNTIEVGNYRTGSISPIIVFALDSGSLASDAYQPQYPNDNIKYDISFNETEVTNGSAFGRIVYRKDERGNEMDYDFREVLFKRYDAYFSEQVYNGTISVQESGSFAFITGSGTSFENFTTGEIVGVLNTNSEPLVNYYEIVSIEDDYRMVVTGSTYSFPSETRLLDANLMEKMSWKQNNILSNTGSAEFLTFTEREVCFNNKCTNTAAYTVWDENTFLLPNNVFKSPDGDSYTDNLFASYFRNNTFSEGLNSNTIMDSFWNNIIDNDFDNNIIADSFYNNIIDCDFRNNTINGEFYNNHFGDDENEDFDYNIIQAEFYNNFYTGDDNFEYNLIKGSFYQNIIRNEFSKNTLNGFYNNVLNATFSDNIVGESFYGNKTYQEFRENTMADEVHDNNFFSSFLGNTITGDEVYNNNFYSWTEDNQIGSSFYNNNIGDSSDYGDTSFRRNKIDNYFYDNVILGDMQDNTITNYFYENTIGNNFQFNDIKTPLNSCDFTTYYGNLFGVSFSNGIAGTNGTYTAVTGSTTGRGVDAEFQIIVTDNTVTTVNVTNGGKLYLANDTITIASGSFGGAADLVLTEDGISSTPLVYGYYNKTIQKAFNGDAVLSVLVPGEGYYPFITANITEALPF